MIASLFIASLVPFCSPQEPESAAPQKDVIRLEIGTEIEGRIVKETADYVEIELSPGTVVGFSKSRTVSIVRAAAPAAERSDRAVAIDHQTHRDDWSVLHDADGSVVGWLHATVTRGADEEIRISEEWRLKDDSGTTELTFLEVLDPDGTPRSCFYHERVRFDGDDRIHDERLVRAVIEDGQLHVRRRSIDGGDQQDYAVPEGLRFPLELQEEMRRRPVGTQGSETHVLFDPRVAEFVSREFDVGRSRRVEQDGEPTRVRVVTAAGSHGANSEWIDAGARVLRREINGPSLVAMPSHESEARSSLHRGGQSFPPAFRVEPGGRFGLWLPHPGWVFEAEPADGTLSARLSLDDAAVSVVRLDHLAPDVMLPSAADALARWLELVQPGLQITSREDVRIRGTAAVRFEGRYDVVVEARHRPFILVAEVFADPEGNWHAVCGCAPKETWLQVEADLHWIVEHVEIRKEGFAPELRGPLAERAR